MKYNSIYRTALIAIMATAATACSSDLPQPDETGGNTTGRTITITASQGADRPQTRLGYTETDTDAGKSMTVKWAADDCFYVSKVTKETNISNSNAFSKFTLNAGEEGKNTASFTGQAGTDWQSNDELHAFYGKDVSIKNGVITYSFSSQTQSANNSTDHISEHDLMHATAHYKEGEAMNFAFEHIGALMKFDLTLPEEADGKKVDNLYLIAADGSKSWTSYYNEDLSGTAADIPTSYFTNRLTLELGKYGARIDLAAGRKLTAYMMMAPTDKLIDKKLTLVVSTIDNSNATDNPYDRLYYKADINGALIEKGKYYTVTASPTSIFNGSGTKDAPYLIEDAGGLTKLSILMSTQAVSAKNKHFEQTANISLTGIDWIPFLFLDGTYDGKNYSITDLNCTTNTNQAGFFASISGSTIKNMNVTGQVTSTCTKDSYVGGIAGFGSNFVITGCTFTGSVTSNVEETTTAKNDLYMGGIIGEAYGNAQITECTNNATVTNENGGAKYIYIGGITGEQGGNSNYYAYTRGCVNTGTITNKADISAASLCYIGGIIGRSGSQSYILACCNTAEIKDEGGENASLACGGIVGNLQATMTGCYNTGAVTSTSQVSGMQIGGIIGGHNSGDVNQCLWVKATGMTTDSSMGSTSGSQIAATADIATLNSTGVETLNGGIYDWNALNTGGDNNPNSLKYCPFYFVAGSDSNTPPTLKAESPGIKGEDSNIVPWQ